MTEISGEKRLAFIEFLMHLPRPLQKGLFRGWGASRLRLQPFPRCDAQRRCLQTLTKATLRFNLCCTL